MIEPYVRAINATRAEHGLGPLRFDSDLQKWALNHAVRCARTLQLWHPKGGGSGNEIAARGQNSIHEAIEAWLASPGHRKILLGTYTHCGVAMVVSRRNGDGVWFAQFDGPRVY